MTKQIKMENIIPGTNIRNEKDDSLYELADSINRHGLIQPITVRRMNCDSEKYEIVSGHRRYEAMKINNEPFIEAKIIDDISDKDRVILQGVENIQRKDMSAFELVEMFDAMKEKYHIGNKQLAHYFNKKEQWVFDTYLAVKILERQYETGEIPEEKKKLTAGQIKKELSNKRKGTVEHIECVGFNVRKTGHNYVINCSTFEAETKLLAFIQENK